ncbi:MAG TPA: ABC transporter permease subunit [Alphaproteobacteria bacterium]|jgi:putrescine transport system permease protein|nr:ABC transporter permease subunit [Alphaproteobacteria bacterium]
MREGGDRLWRGTVIGAPLAWLVLFFALPFVIVLAISIVPAANSVPPFASPLSTGNWTLESYRLLLSDSLYAGAFANAVRIAATSTAICLLIGYPMAYGIARARPRRRNLLLMLVILPFWTSFLIRVYSWMILLRPTGLINGALLWLGVISEPLPLINNEFAVHLGIVYSYLPFMVLPLYAALERLDPALREAAHDLGARPARTFLAVTLPLSLPGVAAGCLLVFIPAVGEFVIPDLLGGPQAPMIGRVLWNEFFLNRDWPAASAVAVALLVLIVAPIVAVQALERRNTR